MTRPDPDALAHKHADEIYATIRQLDDPAAQIAAAMRVATALRDEIDARGRQLVDELRGERGVVRDAALLLGVSEANVRRAFRRRMFEKQAAADK